MGKVERANACDLQQELDRMFIQKTYNKAQSDVNDISLRLLRPAMLLILPHSRYEDF